MYGYHLLVNDSVLQLKKQLICVTMFLKFIVFLFVYSIQVKSERCMTPNREEAECVYLSSCKILFEVANEGSSSDEFIQKSICGGTKFSPKVCCGSSSNFTQDTSLVANTNEKVNKSKSLLPDRKYCGLQHSDDYFRQENDTSIRINEFPWLAHLWYKNEEKGLSGFKCGGSLINRKYVLTAAHCLQKRDDLDLSGVRLGGYYLANANKSDCFKEPPFDDECSEVEDYQIEKMIFHPNYKRTWNYVNDIGLIRLEGTVVYSDYIRPICLPQPGIILAKPGETLIASGWGLNLSGRRKNTKKRVFNTLITNEECSRRYKFADYLGINEDQLCSIQWENNTDIICAYDSGGPLIFSHEFQWHQEGLLSFGPWKCTEFEIPQVYARVVNYLPWIEENLKP